MTTETRGNLTILAADKGKLLTNGQTYGTTVYLGSHDAAANWREADTFVEGEVEPTSKRLDDIDAALAQQETINDEQDNMLIELYESIGG